MPLCLLLGLMTSARKSAQNRLGRDVIPLEAAEHWANPVARTMLIALCRPGVPEGTRDTWITISRNYRRMPTPSLPLRIPNSLNGPLALKFRPTARKAESVRMGRTLSANSDAI